MAETWTVIRLLRWTTEYFEKKGAASPRLDAEVLLADILNVSRITLYTQWNKPVVQEELERFREHVKKRAQSICIAHILGEKEFFSIPFKVSPGIFVPRPETEHLVEAGLDYLKEYRANHPQETIHVAELGTGSGNVAVALARQTDANIRIHACDKSEKAINFAKQNAAAAKVQDRIIFYKGDLFDPFPEEIFPLRLILSNPPYIPSDEISRLEPEIRNHEPLEALDGGTDGLNTIRRIIEESAQKLAPGGFLGIEIGKGQYVAVKEFLNSVNCFREPQFREDLAGIPRILEVWKNRTSPSQSDL